MHVFEINNSVVEYNYEIHVKTCYNINKEYEENETKAKGMEYKCTI